MSTNDHIDHTTHFPKNATDTPSEVFEVHQTHSISDYKPDPAKSIKLSAARQALVDDVIALYSCEPTVERVKRYTPDSIYDDQFVYANNRYRIAGHWFALPKLFKASKNEGYEIVKNDKDLIQLKIEQSWTFKAIPKTSTVNTLVSLSLDLATVDSDFIQIKYHKDQANDTDYSHEGLGFSFKSKDFQAWRARISCKSIIQIAQYWTCSLTEWQADNVAKNMDSEEAEYFVADKDVGKEGVRTHADGKCKAPITDI